MITQTKILISVALVCSLAILFTPNLAFAATLPGAPSSLTATVQNVVDILLSWTAGSGATSYRIDRAQGSGSFSTLVANTGSAATTFTDGGLPENTQFSYRVFSINGTGTSAAPSNTATATTSGFGSGDCTGDCVPPTLGVDSKGTRWVDEGFSYNGNPVDVESFYTSYPLITTKVGIPNKAVFKVFEDGGPDEVRHLDLAFGLARGQILGDSKASIEWDKSWDGTETVKVIDPQHALENVKVVTSEGQCKTKEVLQQGCLIVVVYHTFRAPLDFNIVATNVWDEKRNTWQNYYNHGVNVVGNSLNPPDVHQVLDSKGYPYTITETSDTTAVDTDSNTWTLIDGFWTKNYVKQESTDQITMHGVDRINDIFVTYKKGQELLAKETLEQILGSHDESYAKQKPIIYTYVSRSEDKQLQKNIDQENNKAATKLKQLFDEADRYQEIKEKTLRCISANTCVRN